MASRSALKRINSKRMENCHPVYCKAAPDTASQPDRLCAGIQHSEQHQTPHNSDFKAAPAVQKRFDASYSESYRATIIFEHRIYLQAQLSFQAQR